jgi:hypothetical protein
VQPGVHENDAVPVVVNKSDTHQFSKSLFVNELFPSRMLFFQNDVICMDVPLAVSVHG